MIALLTDFGLDDIYVGVMKSVIRGIAPEAKIVDLTHSVAPQNIAQGSFLLRGAWDYLPYGAIVVAVVDPGVGTERRPIAARSRSRIFVGPDNGLIGNLSIDEAVELANVKFHLKKRRGATFHGRDIFAPVAAHIEHGFSLLKLGPEIDTQSLVRLKPGNQVAAAGEAIGEVVVVDRFGNLITDIDGNAFGAIAHGQPTLVVEMDGQPLGARVVESYGYGEPNELLLVVSSFGTVELALRNGSAASSLQSAHIGARVRILSP